jgi:4-hydroxy-3-methylbut-2-enyl diphosphate reductase
MKFTTATVVGLYFAGTASAFSPIQSRTTFRPASFTTTTLHQSTETEPSSAVEEQRRRTKKADRLDFMKNDQFHRRGFKEVRDKVEADVQQQYTSELVGELKSSNYVVDKDGVKVYLAKVCYVMWIVVNLCFYVNIC